MLYQVAMDNSPSSSSESSSELVAKYKEQLAVFRQSDRARDDMFASLVAELDKLQAKYENIESEYENEKEGRRMWFQRAKKFENESVALKRTAEASPMVYVVIDGDGAIFRDDLIARGEAGGSEAAHLLKTEVVEYLQQHYPDANIESWNIIVQIVLNMDGQARTLAQAGITTDNHTHLQSFLRSFCRAEALFSVVDVGPGKEEADHKGREMLRVLTRGNQCKHIIFGTCHDTGYIPVIRPLAGDPAMVSRMTLLETTPAHQEFTKLGFERVRFNTVFRDRDLPAPRAPPAFRPSVATPPVRPPAETKNVAFPGLPPPRAVEGPKMASPPPSWAALSKTNTKEISIGPTKKAADARKYYLVNMDNERVDIDLPRTNPQAEKHFMDIVKEMRSNYCNEYHLQGSCGQGEYCSYIHGEPLTGPELLVLKHKARSLLCRQSSDCTNVDCHMGHHCKYGKKCTYPDCRFATTHYVNLTPVAKIYEDGSRQRL